MKPETKENFNFNPAVTKEEYTKLLQMQAEIGNLKIQAFDTQEIVEKQKIQLAESEKQFEKLKNEIIVSKQKFEHDFRTIAKERGFQIADNEKIAVTETEPHYITKI